MKYLALFIFLFSFQVHAQKIWINAPAHSLSAGDKTYSQYLFEKAVSATNEKPLMIWGQRVLEASSLPASFFTELESFEKDPMFSHQQRQYVLDLLAKITETAPALRQKITSHICQWSDLERPFHFEKDCHSTSQSLQFLRARENDLEFVSLEDLAIDEKDAWSVHLDPRKIYNWRLFFRNASPIFFRGTLDDLKQTPLQKDLLVQGDCESFTHQIADLEVVSRGWIYFSRECQKSLAAPETSSIKKWYERNRSWVIPAGIILLGAAAYQLKDKKIIITKPAF